MKKYISNLLSANPLCGISTYKDTLNLATGLCPRQIKKLVFDGTESWVLATINPYGIANYQLTGAASGHINVEGMAVTTHFVIQTTPIADEQNEGFRLIANGTLYIRLSTTTAATKDAFCQWLSDQYNAGTPLTIWYVLATPTSDTITVPSGLSGTVEGYLIQDGTPTPTAPIYPTANPVTMWADYTPNIYNSGWTTASGQPEKYNGGWT